MKAADRKSLSELEGVSLGIVFRRQPCTAYQVRSELKSALSSHWRASAGSIYPLLARLEKIGLIESRRDKDDGRGRRQLQVTNAGKASLRRWILAGVDHDLISSVSDPVRSRMFFLKLLGKKQRLVYLDGLIQKMQQYREETDSHLLAIDEDEEPFNYLGALGGAKITAARLEWLQEVRRRLV